MSSSRSATGLMQSFGSDRSGAVAVLFGFTLLVMLGVTGMGLDMIRADRIATRATAALDAGALAAARAMTNNDSMSDSEVAAIARDTFLANMQSLTAKGATATDPVVTLNRSLGSVMLTSTIGVPTTITRLANVSSVNFDKTATATNNARRVELTMVLDVTGSMNEAGKLDALKNAAKDVIDAVLDPERPGQSRVAVVPYSASVNVGPYANAASGGDSLDGCVMERLFPAERDTDAVSGFPNNYAVNGQLNSPTNTHYACPNAVLMPLSGDRNLLRNTVDSYMAGGWTAGHIGLAWGWNTISPNWGGVFGPASAPGAYGDNRVIKAMIFMTDGIFNTAYSSAGVSDAEQTAEATARTQALCTNIKARNVAIYTVAFQSPPEAEALLRSCATSPAHYFDAADNNQLRDAFRDIAIRLQDLRLTN